MKRLGKVAACLTTAAMAVGVAACGSSKSSATGGTSPAATAVSCPHGGDVRMGVEPYESQATLVTLYNPLVKELSTKLGCKVQLIIGTDYTAEVEAMKANQLELGEFGPLGYVLAHQIADAQAIATFGTSSGPGTYTASVVTYPGSGVTTLAGCAGKTFGYSDPSSTSGHLFPAFALKSAGIDPDNGVKAVYSGTHTASYEAISHHKTVCNELNSQTIATATAAGDYKPSDFVTLWQSQPIPLDPIAVRGDLSPAFKQKLTAALDSIVFSSLGPQVASGLNKAIGGSQLVPTTDGAFNVIRSLVSVLHLDLSKING